MSGRKRDVFLPENIGGVAFIGMLLIVLISLVFNCVQAQTPTNAYDLRFMLNTDNRTDYYEVFFFEGDPAVADTVGLTNFTRVGVFNHDSLAVIYTTGVAQLIDIYPSPQNGESLIGALRAWNQYAGSPVGFSQPYLKPDQRPPVKPATIVIIE